MYVKLTHCKVVVFRNTLYIYITLMCENTYRLRELESRLPASFYRKFMFQTKNILWRCIFCYCIFYSSCNVTWQKTKHILNTEWLNNYSYGNSWTVKASLWYSLYLCLFYWVLSCSVLNQMIGWQKIMVCKGYEWKRFLPV